MKLLNEMKRILRIYGKKIQLYAGDQNADGAGLFCRIYTSSPEQECPQQSKLGRCSDKTYSVWACCSEEMERVEQIRSNGKTYQVLSGEYDGEAGCWRWIVKEENV